MSIPSSICNNFPILICLDWLLILLYPNLFYVTNPRTLGHFLYLMLNSQWQNYVGPHLFIRQDFRNFSFIGYLQLSSLVSWLAVGWKENLCSEMSMTIHQFLSITVFNKMSIFTVFRHSPIFIDLIVLLIEFIEIGKIFFDNIGALIR